MTKFWDAGHRGLAGAILTGGLIAGGIDAVSAIASAAGRGKGAIDMFHYIASGLIGTAAFGGGVWTGLLGAAVHFGLTTIMAAIFMLLAARKPILWQNPLAAGMAFGALEFLAMYYVIAPHTLVPVFKEPVGLWANLSTALTHGCYIGLPIALVAQRFFMGRAVLELRTA